MIDMETLTEQSIYFWEQYKQNLDLTQEEISTVDHMQLQMQMLVGDTCP